MLPKLTLALGGASSGKSEFAENLLLSSGLSPVYLATAQDRGDAEWRARIDRHRARRGKNWRMLEAPLEPGPALAGARTGEAVLLDCATLWLSNHLLAGHDLAERTAALLAALADCAAPVVVVSNEAGLGVVPENALARRFRIAQGELNQALAAQADLVVAVMAGLPLALKGRLPEPAP